MADRRKHFTTVRLVGSMEEVQEVEGSVEEVAAEILEEYFSGRGFLLTSVGSKQ